ncbi:MAG: GntR family transcriptional regulator [Methylocystaceae bacterium]|nr:GntR family transcriptional regulator [Methylocystaceae bacterium]
MNRLVFPSFRRLDRSRLAAPQVLEDLRDKIIRLDLLPRTVLSRVDLQAAYGVSSTPVRDALIKLQEEGLVEIYPQHATFVAPIDLAQARQAHFMRRSIEIEIARSLALSADKSFLPLLKSHIDEQEMLSQRHLVSRFAEADLAFHWTMYEAAKVTDLWVQVRRFSGHIDRIRHLDLPAEGKMNRIITDHKAIVVALEKGEAHGAEIAVRDHLSRSIALTGAMKERNPEYFSDHS